MTFDLKNLSWADFEDLSRDLIGAELNIRFESFAPGPDGGIDGRHAAKGKTILQAKHYAGSRFSDLKKVMVKERVNLDSLKPTRYVLTTSQPLTVKRKDTLAGVIGPYLRSASDIFSASDINGLLRNHQEVLKAHIKLWLSSTAVLEKVLHAASHAFTSITKDEILAKLKVYAQNPSLKEANKTLDDHHIVIIAGPPGVGKTTLGEMLAYSYIVEGWDLIAIRSLDDGLSAIKDNKKQLFLFDDFLGKVALDRSSLAQNDSELARFIKRVRNSPNARFILTTRAYLFEEASRVSEHLADPTLQLSKFVLDVGKYTRRIKARILYNHLAFSGVSLDHIQQLIESNTIKKIIDHNHYNPRIIEWMTDTAHLQGVTPQEYPAKFLDVLEHPHLLWDKAFRTHISRFCQHLLIVLYFESEYGVSLDDLKRSYNSVHPHLSKSYGASHDPKDFEEGIRILEGSFIKIVGTTVNFVNPSVRDYLDNYLSDADLLNKIAEACRDTETAKAIWIQGKRAKLSDTELGRLADSLVDATALFLTLPTHRYEMRHGFRIQSRAGLSNTQRINLLIDLVQATASPNSIQKLSDICIRLSAEPEDGLDSTSDGEECVELISKLRDDVYFGELPFAAQVADNLDRAFIRLLDAGIPSDDLSNISDAVDTWGDLLSADAIQSVHSAIASEINHVEDVVSEMDSESTLKDHAETIRKLASRINLASTELERALEVIAEREAAIDEASYKRSDSPTITSSSRATDSFNDSDLRDLFSTLSFRTDKT